MGRNIVIFSDGTGQAGGFRFDENRSNIYKMFRACRCGPDSSVNPRDQLTFYDPGLGSQADGGHLTGRAARWIYNTISQATGFGITANIVDCYAALIRSKCSAAVSSHGTTPRPNPLHMRTSCSPMFAAYATICFMAASSMVTGSSLNAAPSF